MIGNIKSCQPNIFLSQGELRYYIFCVHFLVLSKQPLIDSILQKLVKQSNFVIVQLLSHV